MKVYVNGKNVGDSAKDDIAMVYRADEVFRVLQHLLSKLRSTSGNPESTLSLFLGDNSEIKHDADPKEALELLMGDDAAVYLQHLSSSTQYYDMIRSVMADAKQSGFKGTRFMSLTEEQFEKLQEVKDE